MFTRSGVIAALAALIGLISTTAAHAGTTGVISGHVFDEYGRPLQGATVELITLREPFELNREVDPKTHELQLRTTSASGFFVFISLDPGFYQIRTFAQGMYFFCPPRVVVDADATSSIDLFMLDHYVVDRCEQLQIFGPM
jgi:hypothetical protein